MPKIHVLFLARWYPYTGDEQLGVFIKKHALAVADNCTVSVLNVRGEKNQSEKFVMQTSISTITELQVFYKLSSSSLLNFFRTINAHFKGFAEIEKRNGKPNLIHVHVMFGLCLTTLILSTVKSLPFIISEHWHGFTDEKFSKQTFLFKKLLHYTAAKAKAITVVSTYLKQGMIKNNFRTDIIVVPNVVESVVEKTTKSDSKIRLLSVADLVDEIKNISSVITAFSEICKTNPNLEYHIIGGGKDETKLKNQAAALGLLHSQLFFHRQQNNAYVLSFLNQCSFVIINSNYETFSVIAAESLLSGKPLVCTRCGGVNDFVDSDCGILIDPGNALQLKNALMNMVTNFKNYDSEKLKSKVALRFNSKVIGEQFYSIYKTVLSNN